MKTRPAAAADQQPELFPGRVGASLSPRHVEALRVMREVEGRPAIVSKFETAVDFLVKERGKWSAPAAVEFVRLVYGVKISNAHRTALGRLVCLRRPVLELSCTRVRGVFDDVAAFEKGRTAT